MEREPLAPIEAPEGDVLYTDTPWNLDVELDPIELDPVIEDDDAFALESDESPDADSKQTPDAPEAEAKPEKPPLNLEADATGGSSTSRMLMEIGRQYPLLTPSAEKNLAQRIERGDLVAKETLFYSNVRLAASIAKRYRGQGLSYDDLVQEGFLGLVRATEKFDYRKGFRFTTYATAWIKQAIQRALENKSRTIRLPTHVAQKARKVERSSNQLRVNLGRAATTEEISADTNIEPEKVEELQDHIRRTTTTSLDKPVGDDGDSTLGDFTLATGGEDEIIHEVASKERLSDLRRAFRVAGLTSREEDVLLHRFGLADDGPEKTQQETGQALDMSRAYASRVEMNALHKLRIQRQRISEILKEAA